MDEPQPGPSHAPIPVIKQDTVTSEDDSSSIPFADSPDSPPLVGIRKASVAAQHNLHDGIILLITSDTESQRSPNGSIAQHPLSEFYLLPLPQDALSSNRRYSLQDRSGKNHHIHPERKASCPDAELHLSPDRSRRSSTCSRKSELDISKDRLTPTSFSSRRSSNASVCHSSSRRSSNCSLAGHHRRRSSNCTNCSRRSSTSSVSHSRRSSTASHRSSPSHCSRRSSNCSRRSSHFDSDEESFLHQHSSHHHHHCHRGSRSSLDPLHRGSTASVDIGGMRRGSHLPSPQQQKEELDEQEELEMGGIPARHRRIIIMIIGSVSIFILVMSVVLIAVSLTLSPTIDDL
ncbi:probable serine/threonine-protein kinase DDB_G0282963, partial [Stegodyphus dumicola]|uniref:probable serine/threonine-protein kinase DDB_G0282963 n=1 Tax=Stegodyphus dumicola TaxID=202533 RepID=UPI0015B215E8